ncbi:MAG TPA: branched-chain amino acid ABC transporter ATP-binding protein/permease [Candidatus Dormibacteraeota bacterium]|jgi:sulfate-transporting ATPase|nr:branched-chain amino acid ABC transporter ATP-binding protein/permease [Candidatus Dormibacteraeota bacterium]
MVWVTVLLVGILVLPFAPLVPADVVNTAVLACLYLIVTLSLVLLVGLVGQISLAQAAFVGMGAFVSAIFTLRLGVHFPFTLLVGAGSGALTATVIGLVALRVRGLFLAVATLIFTYLCDQYLFTQPWLVPSQSGVSIGFEAVGIPGTFPYFDLGDVRVFYYVAVALAAFALYSVANLRDSRVGRAMAAVRGSEVAAASLGVNVMRFKLLAFACAGGLAGLAGTLFLISQRNVAPQQFNFLASLFFLSIAVVGGLRSLGGAIASAAIFAVLVDEVFYRAPKLADYLDLVSAGLLIAVLLFFRGGLGALPERLAEGWRLAVAPRLERWRAGRAPGPPAAGDVTPVVAVSEPEAVAEARPSRPRQGAPVIDVVEIAASILDRPEPAVEAPRLRVEPAPDRAPARTSAAELLEAARKRGLVAGEPGPGGRRLPVLIAAEGVTVQFGGLRAVDGASLSVGAGEIVGLIGPNGAGKTTMFNALLGLNTPAAGRVLLHGADVSRLPVHARAARGVGRTFQILQLFGDLTVFDNLLVATHLQNPTGLFGALFVTPRARRHETEARLRVEAVLELMQLDHLAHRRVAGLPFGVLRLIEVARTLVTGAPLVCFDEPASGLDSAETENLIDWFRFLKQIGVTLLVIEHDVSMVVRLCDYIYVLDQGRLIAEGTPAAIQRDPHVISSYLGASVEEAS